MLRILGRGDRNTYRSTVAAFWAGIQKPMKEEEIKTVTDRVTYLLALTFFFLLVSFFLVNTQREVEIERRAKYSKHTVWGECMIFLSFRVVKLIAGIYFIGQ